VHRRSPQDLHAILFDFYYFPVLVAEVKVDVVNCGIGMTGNPEVNFSLGPIELSFGLQRLLRVFESLIPITYDNPTLAASSK
jgi:hypothetical protein